VKDPTQRFSNRVDDYVRYRPSYPRSLLKVLENQCGLTAEATVVDVGSGTGKLSELFLEHGNFVVGVEPNGEMRAAAERLLSDRPRFSSVAGRAEAIPLPDASADYIIAGQAFHWFDAAPTRREFARLLKPGCWCVLIWNERRLADTPFMTAYNSLLHRHAVEYRAVDHRNVDGEAIGEFYSPDEYHETHLPYVQHFDRDGLRGRLMSSSYAPTPDEPAHPEMMRALEQLFNEFAENDRVTFHYDTRMYYGHLRQGS